MTSLKMLLKLFPVEYSFCRVFIKLLELARNSLTGTELNNEVSEGATFRPRPQENSLNYIKQ